MMNIYQTIDEIKLQGPSAIALGAFDGLHRGHCSVIGGAVNSPWTPSVFTFCEDPSKLLSGKTEYLMTGEDKREALQKMGVQNLFQVEFASVKEMEPEDFFSEVLVKRCRAAMLTCGEDFRFGRNASGNTALLRELCRKNNIQLRICPPALEGGRVISSTAIRQALGEGRVELANRMLGHAFYFTLPVVDGNRIGRTLGTPTINQVLPEGFIRPKFGVYAAMVRLNGSCHWGVANIGTKPTIGKYDPLAETWIGEFSGDLYGKRVRLELVGFIREERKFASLEELKAEILRNASAAREMTEAYLAGGACQPLSR